MLDTTKQLTKVTYEQQSFILPKGGATEGGDCSDIITGTITELTADRLQNVATIRMGAFENVTSLQKVSIPSNVTTIGANAFSGCTGITSLTLAEGVQTIGTNAFSGITAPFEIPRSLVSVGDGAFANNLALTSMTIPSTLTSLPANMFAGCSNLTEITMEATTPPSITSTTLPSSVTAIYVEYGAYDTYKSQWSAYSSKIVRLPAIPSTITVTVNDYNGELVSGASVTITGNGQTYTGTTNESGVFVQGDLQPATYTISVADLEGYKTPASQDVVVEENTQNSVTITYLEKQAGFAGASVSEINAIANDIATKGMTSAEVEATYGWKLGDTKDITLTTGEVIQMRIIGFNHDTLTSGLGTAGVTLQTVNSMATRYYMNSPKGSKGGYAKSALKTTTLPMIKDTIPEEWLNIIQFVNKNSANGAYSEYTQTLTLSEDIFLLSEIEVMGKATYAKAGNTEGTVYEFWNGKGNSARIKKYDADGDGVPETNYLWWLRSAYYNNQGAFCSITTEGKNSYSDSYYPFGISFAFCIGAPQPSRTFSENSPSMISAISSQISANNMTSSQVAETYGWNIGDTISYDLTTGKNVEMRIAGFNHDDKSDGTGKAGITLEMSRILGNYAYNNTDTNAGGYSASVLRNTTLPTIKATIPTEWQNVIKKVNKVSGNGGSTNYTENVTTSDDLFLLSRMEILGNGNYVSGGTSEGVQYEYYANGGSAIKGLIGGSLTDWWMRSAPQNGTGEFYVVNTSGGGSTASASGRIGVSFAFCI